MLSGMNPQSENETLRLFEDAQKHPDMWLMMRQQELEIFRRRWFDFPHQNGRAEIFFRLVQEHLNLTRNAPFLLRQEHDDKA